MSNPTKEKKKMKKFILSLGLVAMMLNLTNCAQYEDVNPTVEPQGEFALYAPISRTANDGLNTVWKAGDQLNIFHAEAGTTNYLNDTPYANSAQNPFMCEDATIGRFLGKLLGGALEESKSYDWYAFYPYSSYITTPANTSNGYMPVGAKSGVAQTQNGNNSMAHLAGGNYPLAGVAKAVAAGTAPTVAMKNLTSVLEFEVTNSLAEAITISEISFTAPVDINGTYYINFVDLDNVVFTGSGANFVSKTAILKVEDGTAIAAGASAKFYLAVKPFTAAVGNELNISVAATSETGSGTHNKTITLDKEVVFSAGKIKTVKVDYNTAIKSADEIEWVNNAYNLVPSTAALTVGDKVIFVANKYDFAMGAQNSNNRASVAVVKNSDNTVTFSNIVTIFTVESGSTADSFAFKSNSKYIYAASSGSNHLKEESSLSANSSWSVSIVEGVATIKANGTNTRNWMRFNSTDKLFSCYSSGQTDISIYKLVGEYTPADPAIELTINDAPLAYDATSGSVSVAANYSTDWTITATANVDWVYDFVYNASSKTITFASKANDGEARSATVTVIATREGYTDVETTFDINQAAKPSGEITKGTAWSYTFTEKQWSANGAKTLNGLSWTLAGDGSYWGYDGTKGQQLGSGGAPYKSMTLSTAEYQGGVETIKINTSGAKSIAANFTVSVGGKQIGNATTLTTSATEYTFTSTELLTGDIVITYTQTSSKAIYIKSIKIN